MGDIFDSGKKFTGDLSDQLPPRHEETPDRWVDRLRHAWFVYLLAAVFVPLWVACLVVTILDAFWFRSGIGYLTLIIVTVPFMAWKYLIEWRILTSRDPDTGEKLGQQK